MATKTGQRVTVLRTDITSPVGAVQWLLLDRDTGDHYIASGVNAFGMGWEVLVFPADREGNITGWTEVAGGRGMTHEGAIADLIDVLDNRP